MLLKNTIYSSINSTLRFFASALLYIILARALGVEEFGRFMFALSFTGIFLTFIDYGFNLLIVKEVSQKPESLKNWVSSIINAKILLSIAFTIILIITLKILKYPDDTLLIVGILWLSVIFYSFGFFFNNVFRGLNQFQYETYPTILLNAAQFVIVGVFLLLGFKTLSVAIAYLLARMFYFAYSSYLLSSKVSKIPIAYNLSESIKSLKIALPYGIHAILATLYFQIDTVFLSYFKGNAEVGYYQASMRILMATMIVYEVIGSAFFPILSKSYNNPNELKKKSIMLNEYMIFFGGSILTFFFVYSEFVMNLLYGEKYNYSVNIMKLLSVVIFLRFIASGYAILLTITGEQKTRAFIVIISTMISAISNLILIPKFNAIGAAIANIITHIVLATLCIGYGVKVTRDAFFYNNRKLLLMLVVIFLVCYFIKGLTLYFSLFLYIFLTVFSFFRILNIRKINKKILSQLTIGG